MGQDRLSELQMTTAMGSTQIYQMPAMLGALARTFPGIRRSLSRWQAIQQASHCRVDEVLFGFDADFMDRKRFVALAAGAIEAEEVILAAQMISTSDVVVEFGAGLGIAAARVHKRCRPARHICFEANPRCAAYSTPLFAQNQMQIELVNKALGNGQALAFYAMQDYILSSFDRPDAGADYTEIEVETVPLAQVLAEYRPDAVFCDIEGAELAYFTAEDFSPVQKIIIELHPKSYGKSGLDEFIRRMQQHGFALTRRLKDTYCFVR